MEKIFGGKDKVTNSTEVILPGMEATPAEIESAYTVAKAALADINQDVSKKDEVVNREAAIAHLQPQMIHNWLAGSHGDQENHSGVDEYRLRGKYGDLNT